MGLFDKLMFWRKDDLDFDKLAQEAMHKESLGHDDPFLSGANPSTFDHKSAFDAQSGFGASPTATPSYSQPTSPAMPKDSFDAQRLSMQSTSSRDMELVNSKLDTIKVMLNSIDARLANVEKNSNAGQKPPQQRLW